MSLLPDGVSQHLASDGTAVTALAALVLGLSGSLHCFFMCGPLACAAATGPRANSARLAWQAARFASYGLMGGLLGAFGGGFARAVTLPLRAVTPWFLVAALVASALDLGRRIAPAPGLANILRRLMRYGAKFSPTARGALMGGMTPLLPCGLLYGIYATAFTAGSFGRGLLLMLAFAAGGVPSLLLAQYSMGLSARLGPRGALVLKRVVPLVAAAVLAWRALATSAGHSCH